MQISVRFGQLCNEFDRSSSSMLVGASSSSVYKSLSSMTLSSSKRQSLANVKSMPDLSSRTATSTTTATVAIPLDSSGEIKPGPNVVNSVAERQRQQLIEQMQQYRSDFCKSRQYCIDTLHALSSHGGGMPHCKFLEREGEMLSMSHPSPLSSSCSLHHPQWPLLPQHYQPNTCLFKSF